MKKVYPSFMCQRKHYARSVDFWSPKISDDWAEDTARGKAYADEAVACIRVNDNPSALGHVIKAMIGKGGYSGVETGFFHRLSEHLLNSGFSHSDHASTPDIQWQTGKPYPTEA